MPEIQRVLPKYMQIANYLRDQILRGDLQPGDEVPSERQLVADWTVARPTAARALEALRSQGFVESRQGSGTFVSSRMRPNRLARERYSRAREIGKIYPANEHAEILAAGPGQVPEHVAEALGLPLGAKAVQRRRLIHADDEPIELSTAWYSTELVESAPDLLLRERIRAGTIAYIEQCTGRQARYAQDQMSARPAEPDERQALRLPDPSAVLVVRHVVYDAADQPIEFTEAVYPPHRWAFETTYPVQ